MVTAPTATAPFTGARCSPRHRAAPAGRGVVLLAALLCLLAAAPPAVRAEDRVTRLGFKALAPGREQVRIHLEGEPDLPTIFAIDDPQMRLVCDFPDTGAPADLVRPHEVNGRCVHRIRVGRHDSPDPKLRIVLDLAADRRHAVEPVFYRREHLLVLEVTCAPRQP